MSYERHFMIVIDPGYFMDDKRKDRLMTADAYVAEVRNVIRQIAQTQVGSRSWKALSTSSRPARTHSNTSTRSVGRVLISPDAWPRSRSPSTRSPHTIKTRTKPGNC